MLDAEERILEIENRFFEELRSYLAQNAQRIRAAAAAVAELDVLGVLTHLAAERDYVRP